MWCFEAFRPQFEVVDQGFHARPNFRAGRWDKFGILRAHRAHRQFVHGLLDNPNRLAHFFDVDQVAGVDIALGSQRYFEIVLFVTRIWRKFTHIVIDARGAQGGPGQTPVGGLGRRNGANAHGAVEKERIPRQQGFVLVNPPGDDFEKIADGGFKFNRHIPPDAAGANVGGHHPHAGDQLEDIQNHFAFAEAVHEIGHGSQVEGGRSEPNQVRGKPLEFGQDDAQALGANGNIQPDQLFNSQRVGQVVPERIHIIQPVAHHFGLLVGLGFHIFFDAGMQKADVGNGIDDGFAVQFEQHPQNPMRGGMLRAHVQEHRFAAQGALRNQMTDVIEGSFADLGHRSSPGRLTACGLRASISS